MIFSLKLAFLERINISCISKDFHNIDDNASEIIKSIRFESLHPYVHEEPSSNPQKFLDSSN